MIKSQIVIDTNELTENFNDKILDIVNRIILKVDEIDTYSGWDEYDKVEINNFIDSMKKKEIRILTAELRVLWDMVTFFGLKVEQNAFYFSRHMINTYS